MIAFEINGEALDLYPDLAISIQLINPIFDQESVVRVFSYPFRVPATGKNDRLLKYGHRLDSRHHQVVLPCLLRLNGQPFDFGELYLTTPTDQHYSVRFANPEIDLLEQLDTIQINTLLPTIQIPIPPAPDLRFEADDSGLYEIVIDGKTYASRDQPYTKLQGLNVLKDRINADFPGFASVEPNEQLKLLSSYNPLPNIELQTLVNLSLVVGKAADIHHMESVYAYMNDVIENDVATHCFPMIRNIGLFPFLSYKGYVNYYLGGSNLLNTGLQVKEWYHSIIPQVRVKYLLEQIAQAVGLDGVAGSMLDSFQWENLLLYNNRTIDEVVLADLAQGNDQWLNRHKSSFDLNDHVPELSAKELLTAFQDTFNFYLAVKDNQLHLVRKVEQLRQNAIDWTTRAEYGYELDIPRRKGFRMEFTRPDSELMRKPQLYRYQDGQRPQISLFFPFYQEEINVLLPALATMPHTNHEGSSEAIGQNVDSGLRLLMYFGLQPDRDGNLYPMAGHSVYNSQGLKVGDQGLSWDQPEGLYRRQWKDYIELEDQPKLRKNLRLTVTDLLELRKWNNSARYIYHEQGAVKCFVKSVNVKATPNALGASRVDFVIANS